MAYALKGFAFSWPVVSGAVYYRLGEDPTNRGNFTVLADNLTTTAHAVQDLTLTQPPAAWRYALQACNANGCSAWSLPVTPDATRAIGYFKPTGATTGSFGTQVALSSDGNMLAVAGDSLLNLFTRSGGQWSLVQALSFPLAGIPKPVFADDGTLLVGLYGIDGGSPDEGQVQVYAQTPGGWTLSDTWNPPTPTHLGSFGAAVGLSRDGTVAVVGELSPFSAGLFHVYRRSGGVWSREQTVVPAHAGAMSLFGIYANISADGSTIVVGAQQEDSGSTTDEADTSTIDAGAAFVYGFDGASGLWTQRAYLKAPTPSAVDFFGAATAISGNGATVVIGARFRDVVGTTNAGAAYVFRRAAGLYALDQTIVSPQATANGVFGGRGLALTPDGSTLAIGETGDSSAGVGVGAAPTPSGMTSAGATHLYRFVGTAFTHAAYIKASNTGSNDGFGWSLAITPDGRMLAVGANGEGSTATGIGGDATNDGAPGRGAVYLY